MRSYSTIMIAFFYLFLIFAPSFVLNYKFVLILKIN